MVSNYVLKVMVLEINLLFVLAVVGTWDAVGYTASFDTVEV